MKHAILFLIFTIASLPLAWVCRRQLCNPRCHGFYRFFAFECLLALALINLQPAKIELFSITGIAAGLCMLGSLGVVALGLNALGRAGTRRQKTPENFDFENTETLVTDGIYRYIRHPMYSSLLLLGLGITLQGVAVLSCTLFALVCLFVWLTAKTEEKENSAYFGESYKDYQRRSKMLLPLVL